VPQRPFESVHLSELDAVPVSETLVWRPVRRRLDVRAFGVNAYTAESAGDEIVEEHDELGTGAGHHEELYFVAAGHARFVLDGQEIDAPAGTFVFVRDPAVRRAAQATAPDSTVLALGGRRGEAFEVSPWEHYFAAIPHARAGDYDTAVSVVEGGLGDNPDNPSLLYNLACFEALAGRRADALAHVRRAFELDPKTREWAETDSDLDSIRDDL
jgi:tetratricopeptide (TPR) repeat protein